MQIWLSQYLLGAAILDIHFGHHTGQINTEVTLNFKMNVLIWVDVRDYCTIYDDKRPLAYIFDDVTVICFSCVLELNSLKIIVCFLFLIYVKQLFII